jgi:alcohol dehydrogenase (NADP+)
MTTVAKAYVATSATELQPGLIERREPGEFEVRISIKFTGVCHSDIHTARGEWAGVNYPIVVGHEIAGIVEVIGPKVTRHVVGDRVGVRCFVDSCRECENCLAGEEQYCFSGAVSTYNSTGRDGLPTAGGYSTSSARRKGSALLTGAAVVLSCSVVAAGLSPAYRGGAYARSSLELTSGRVAWYRP